MPKKSSYGKSGTPMKKTNGGKKPKTYGGIKPRVLGTGLVRGAAEKIRRRRKMLDDI